jgi:hypothetical protein
MTGLLARIAVVLSALLYCAAVNAFGQSVAPLYSPSLDNQLYVGYERSTYDYGLVTASGTRRAVTNGVNVQYAYRQLGHVALIGTARYGSGSLFGQKMMTVAGGAGYVLSLRRFQPFVQGTGGLARLSSSHSAGDMYLGAKSEMGFTTLVGGGVDVAITPRWGVRPLYLENQYLPFGVKKSVNWNLGGGVVYRFLPSSRRPR